MKARQNEPITTVDTNVTKKVDSIRRINDGIVLCDDCFVMFLNGLEVTEWGSIVSFERENIGMAKVMISRDPSLRRLCQACRHVP